MTIQIEKIGFGGSCHWCTEAIFQALHGVIKVHQGWIASTAPSDQFSEAVIVEFEPKLIPLQILIAIHLHTHSCTSNHSMRDKYRSAIYTFKQEQIQTSLQSIQQIKKEFSQPIITMVLPFVDFKPNKEEYLDYYQNDPSKPFCKNFIEPKLKQILQHYAQYVQPSSSINKL